MQSKIASSSGTTKSRQKYLQIVLQDWLRLQAVPLEICFGKLCDIIFSYGHGEFLQLNVE